MRLDHRASLRMLVRVALCCTIAGRASASAQQPDGYAVRQSYVLTPPGDHMRGRIELLEDARIRPEMRRAIAAAFGGDPCADRPPHVLDPLCSDPHHAPLRPAMLRLVDSGGNVVATRLLERPLAQIGVAHLYANARRSYMLTVDGSAGFGSYSGPYTRFAEPGAHGMGWLTADSAGVADTMTLVSTLKSAWKTLHRPADPNTEFLMVLCRPDFKAPLDSAAFTVTYERYTFDGARWHVHGRTEPGFYEADDPFPTDSKFPY